MRFGFVVHPLAPAQKALIGVRALNPGLAFLRDGPSGRVARFERIVSVTGAVTGGEVRAVPLLPATLLHEQARSVERIAAAVREMADAGAGIVGLGALCAVVGLRGEEVARMVPTVPVTTGASFTAFAAVRTLSRVSASLGEGASLAGATVAVAGFPGALATGIAELLVRQGALLILAGAGQKTLERIALRLNQHGSGDAPTESQQGGPPPEDAQTRGRPGANVGVESGASGVKRAVERADFVVGASSTGSALDPAWLTPGTVVIDVAEPRDLPQRAGGKRGVLVVDGENVSLPSGSLHAFGTLTRLYNWVVGQRRGTLYACFAEPIVLALEGRAESFSLGKTILPEKAEEIGRLAERHGFFVDRLLHRGREITPARLAGIAELRRERRRARADGQGGRLRTGTGIE